MGLVLLVALGLGALVAFRGEAEGEASSEERGLGRTVLERITCAARESCGGDGAAGGVALGTAPRGTAAPHRPAAPRPTVAQATNAFRSLRGLRLIAKRTWILCLGYKRWRYEQEHGLLPTQVLPVPEALRIANECLNPYSYLGGD
jgi:hypothetical protein